MGSSTIAHNLAWTVAREQDTATVIADLDVAFGTASLNFNQDPPQGIARRCSRPSASMPTARPAALEMRRQSQPALGAATLDRTVDLTEPAFDALTDLLRAAVPCIVLDVPHRWSAWTRRVLIGADEILIVAARIWRACATSRTCSPCSRQLRPQRYAGAGDPQWNRRAEAARDRGGRVRQGLDLPLQAVIPFDPALFGTAANNGR